MPNLVEVPGFGNIEFPDDTTPEQMAVAIKQAHPIGNPVAEHPPDLKTIEPRSMGEQALRNLPSSVGKMLLSTPGPMALSAIVNGAPDNPIEKLKDIGKDAYHTFRHPAESFAEDPVGTAATLIPTAESAYKLGPGIARGAAEGYNTGVANALANRSRTFGHFTMGGTIGALAHRALGLSPYEGVIAGGTLEAGLPVAMSAIKGAARGGLEAFRDMGKSVQEYKGTRLDPEPIDYRHSDVQLNTNSIPIKRKYDLAQDIAEPTPEEPQLLTAPMVNPEYLSTTRTSSAPIEDIKQLAEENTPKIKPKKVYKKLTKTKAGIGIEPELGPLVNEPLPDPPIIEPEPIKPPRQSQWKDIPQTQSQVPEFTPKKPNMDVIRVPKEVYQDIPKTTEEMTGSYPKRYEGHANPTAAWKLDQRVANQLLSDKKFNPKNLTVESYNRARQAIGSKPVTPEKFESDIKMRLLPELQK